LHKWGSFGREDGQFRLPQSIAFDAAGSVYVLDLSSVQKFTSDGQFLAKWKTEPSSNRRIAVDNRGTVYVTQQWKHRVLRYDSQGKSLEQWGICSTRSGQFNSPQGVAVDAEGNVFVVDKANSCLQKFNSDGQFLDEWDTGYWMTISGMATDMSGNLYITLMAIDQVYKINSKGEFVRKWGWMGEKDGEFRHPSDIAVDLSGSVYVADRNNHRIQKFDPNGTFLTKWGTRGSGRGEFTNPRSIALDGSGNILVLDQPGGPEAEKSRIQKFDLSGGFIADWIVSVVSRITCDTNGNIYATDHDGTFIEKFDPNGNLVATIRENDGGVFSDICTDKTGLIYATDLGNARIEKFDSEGTVIATWPAKSLEVLTDFPSTPGRIAVDRDGNLYVHNGAEVLKLSSTWELIAKYQIAEWGPKYWCSPTDVATDTSGRVYVCSVVNSGRYRAKPLIHKFESDGQFVMQWQWRDYDEESMARDYPISIALDSKLNIYVTDTIKHAVTKFDRNGQLIKDWGSKGFGNDELDEPEGVAVDEAGNVYVCDRQNCRIQKFDSDGKFLTNWGRRGSRKGEFHFPAAVALDKEGNVYVVDSNNHRIQKFTADGRFLTEWGEFGEAPGQLNVPLGIAVDASGNVYVSDSHNHRIQKFAPVPSR
jgi:DNA-binding beta-propeller fold protein YncE